MGGLFEHFSSFKSWDILLFIIYFINTMMPGVTWRHFLFISVEVLRFHLFIRAFNENKHFLLRTD